MCILCLHFFVISANLTDREMLQLGGPTTAAQYHQTADPGHHHTEQPPLVNSEQCQLKLEVAMAAQAQTVQVRLCLCCMLIAPCFGAGRVPSVTASALGGLSACLFAAQQASHISPQLLYIYTCLEQTYS